MKYAFFFILSTFGPEIIIFFSSVDYGIGVQGCVFFLFYSHFCSFIFSQVVRCVCVCVCVGVWVCVCGCVWVCVSVKRAAYVRMFAVISQSSIQINTEFRRFVAVLESETK